MQTLIATIIFIGLAMVGMAVGVIFSNRSLKGSCGGTGKECSCDETTRESCEFARQAKAASH